MDYNNNLKWDKELMWRDNKRKKKYGETLNTAKMAIGC